MTTRWQRWVVISALCTSLCGCAATRRPHNLQALPQADGRIQLAWDAVFQPTGELAGYEVQRSTDGIEWMSVALFESPWQRRVVWVAPVVADTVPTRWLYRVTGVRRGTRTRWSNVAAAVPVFSGLPLYGWVDASQARECRADGEWRSALQCAFDSLGGRAGPGEDPTRGPHVLFFPAGRYEVDRTLWLEGRAGVQFVGARRGAAVVFWSGPAGADPESASVLFHSEGNRDSTWRNIVWDGGCDDPDSCFVVAFDQSFCGRSDLWILRSETCGEQRLGWPERPDVGESDNGGAHTDSTFRNAWIGLRIGHHGVADDTSTLRRCEFSNNYAGVSLEDFNALQHGFWDPLFRENTVGITNNLAALQFADEPVRQRRHWAGEFSIVRGRFERNSHTDIWAEPTGRFLVRDSVSSGSGRFFFAAGLNAAPGRFSLIGNRVRTTHYPSIESATPGPLLLLDNMIFGADHTGTAPVRLNSITGLDSKFPDLGNVDLIALGNRFDSNVDEAYEFLSPHRSHVFDGPAIDGTAKLEVTPLPVIASAERARPVYTVTDATSPDADVNARQIQIMIDAAAADGRPAIVHFPGIDGRYLVSRSLTIPLNSDLILTGDGAWTRLQWVGKVGQPILTVNAATIKHLEIRDLQFYEAGIDVSNLDASGEDVLLSRVRVAEAGLAAMRITGLRVANVDLLEIQINSGLFDEGNGVGIRVDFGTHEPGPGGKIAVWSGIALRNPWDFDVSGDGELLINSFYMERSQQHLRLRGSGTVEEHSVKVATIVPLSDPGDAEEMRRATAAIQLDEYEGNYSLVQSQLFIVDPASTGESASAAVEHGARVRMSGGTATTRLLGVTVRGPQGSSADALDEFSFDENASADAASRIAGKLAQPSALPWPDVYGPATSARREIEGALRLVRDWNPPGFPDEQVDSGRHRVVFDKVFIFRPPGVGLTLR